MAVHLPYNLHEGQVAYAAKVMANFRALLGAYGSITVDGIGTADVPTMLQLLYEAMVKADEDGNADHIRFEDGETLTQKFNAGTLNASILDSEGLFYFYVDPEDGHLYVTASEGMEADDFEIDENGHLVFTLNDPEGNNAVNVYDLGKVKGDKGEDGDPGMDADVYDPLRAEKDVNTYTGFFGCYAAGWGDYFLTEDSTFDGDKTYYTYDSVNDEYTEAVVVGGEAVTANTYYEKLANNEYRLTDDGNVGGATLDGHITAISGHAYIGPAGEEEGGDADGANAWSNAKIWASAQGNGWILFKALGDIPEADIILQVTMFV